MIELNNPDTPVRPGGAKGPIYPRISKPEGDFFETEDPWTFIESITWPDSQEPEAPVIVYVQFKGQRRWRMMGNCNRCGIGDFSLHRDGSIDFGDYNISLESGKTIGEVNSVRDQDYDTRRDYPCTPEYDRLGRKQAAIMGIPYVCGLRFEELDWIY